MAEQLAEHRVALGVGHQAAHGRACLVERAEGALQELTNLVRPDAVADVGVDARLRVLGERIQHELGLARPWR